MAVSLSTLKSEDVLTYWHDTGAMGCQIAYARVEKVGAKMVRVVIESGEAAWKRPCWFVRRLSDEQAAQVRAEGVRI